MNYRLISAIVKGNWAISEKVALGYGPILYNLLSGKTEIVLDDSNPIIPSTVKNISVITISGPLMKNDQDCGGPAGMETIGEYIKTADDDSNVSAIILKIDSPGGTVDGTFNLATIIKNTTKPIISFVDGMAASAAYWIASAADEIIASNDMDEIGSIGVMLHFADLQPYYEKEGVKFHEIYAEQSKNKNKLFRDVLKGEYEQYREEVLNPLADVFINAVKENRKNKVTDAEVFTGKDYFAKDAVKNGLIDAIGSFDYAVSRAIALADEKNKNLNSKKTNTMTKEYKSLQAALKIEKFEATKEGIYLNEEQLETIEQLMVTGEAAEQTRKQLNDETVATASKMNAALDAIDETVSKAEGTENKIAAIATLVNKLKEQPAEDSTKIDSKGDGKQKVSTDEEANTLYKISQYNKSK